MGTVGRSLNSEGNDARDPCKPVSAHLKGVQEHWGVER